MVHRPLSYFMGTTSRMMAFFSVTHIFLFFTLASCIMFLLSTNKFSILISIHVLKELVEKINFDKRSENFLEVIILSILIILYHDDILKLLRENWFWSLLGSLICCLKPLFWYHIQELELTGLETREGHAFKSKE